jgi:N-acyl-L-homoserine lactone synthetase
VTAADEPVQPPPPTPDLSATLLAADDLARGLVAAAAPIRLEVARSKAEREAVYRLRYQVVVSRGWARPEDLPEGMERDSFDERAIHILGWDGESLIATARIVLPLKDALLPTEQAFDLVVEPRGQVADMGRQIVSSDYTSPQHRVFAALLARTWLEIRAAGFSLICGDFTAPMLRLYRIMGFQVAQLGPARPFWGEERFPILVDVASSASKLIDRWNQNTPARGSGA